MAEIEAIVEPDGTGNDTGWESVTFICVHLPILSSSRSLLGNTDSAVRPFTATLAPASRNALAVARPMPRLLPVTSMRWFLNMLTISLYDRILSTPDSGLIYSILGTHVMNHPHPHRVRQVRRVDQALTQGVRSTA